MFSRVTLSTLAADQPAGLPADLVGLDLSSLVDLTAAIDPVPVQYDGVAFWPVEFHSVDLNPRTHTTTGTYTMTVDAEDKRVAAQPVLRTLTADEIAALPPVPVAPMPSISDRQFFQALATAPYSIITAQEALDAVKTGDIPPVMQAVIDQLPADQQFSATMLIAGGTIYQRDNPLVTVFGASQGMDAAAIDAFWTFAGAL